MVQVIGHWGNWYKIAIPGPNGWIRDYKLEFDYDEVDDLAPGVEALLRRPDRSGLRQRAKASSTRLNLNRDVTAALAKRQSPGLALCFSWHYQVGARRKSHGRKRHETLCPPRLQRWRSFGIVLFSFEQWGLGELNAVATSTSTPTCSRFSSSLRSFSSSPEFSSGPSAACAGSRAVGGYSTRSRSTSMPLSSIGVTICRQKLVDPIEHQRAHHEGDAEAARVLFGRDQDRRDERHQHAAEQQIAPPVPHDPADCALDCSRSRSSLSLMAASSRFVPSRRIVSI